MLYAHGTPYYPPYVSRSNLDVPELQRVAAAIRIPMADGSSESPSLRDMHIGYARNGYLWIDMGLSLIHI